MLTSQKRIVFFSVVHLPLFVSSLQLDCLVNCQFSSFPADFHCRNCKNLLIAPNHVPIFYWHGAGLCFEKFPDKVCGEKFSSMFCTLKGKKQRGFFSCCHMFSGIILNVFLILLSLILCSLGWNYFVAPLWKQSCSRLINNNTLYKYCRLFNISINEIFPTQKMTICKALQV